jgi:uncharacterized protein
MLSALFFMRTKYLVLLTILLLVIPLTIAESPSEIKITYLVNDYGNIFSDAQEELLSSSLLNIYNSKIAEVSIVTIKSLDGYDIQMFAQEISNENLGNSETNNGLLLLIAVEDRAYWFNVGRGLEPIFNDAKVGRIGRELLVPYFKEESYFEGSMAAINEIANELQVELTNKVAIPTPRTQPGISPGLIFLIVFFIMSMIRSIAAKGQGKHGTRKDNGNLFFAAMLASSMLRGGRGGFGGGGSFGGFGGGGFGGGGAGGGW